MRSVGVIAHLRPRLLVGLATVLGVALLAGCGGGGDDDDPSEDALRSRLTAAFQKTDDARSIRTLDFFEVASGDGGETVAGCLDITVVRSPGEAEGEDLVLRSLVDDCDHGSVTGEIAIVGSSFWVSSGNGRFRPGTIDTKLVPELTEEGIDFGDLPSVATDVELGDAPTEGTAADAGPTYEFEAPASALSDDVGVDDTDLDFTATTDSRGYLTGLTAEIEVEGATGRVEQTYEEIDQVAPVQPPPRKFVNAGGQPIVIKSEGELKRLIANLVPEEL